MQSNLCPDQDFAHDVGSVARLILADEQCMQANTACTDEMWSAGTGKSRPGQHYTYNMHADIVYEKRGHIHVSTANFLKQ